MNCGSFKEGEYSDMPGVVTPFSVNRQPFQKSPIEPPATENSKADTRDSIATIDPASHDVVFSLAI
jgi:hypothetical protein